MLGGGLNKNTKAICLLFLVEGCRPRRPWLDREVLSIAIKTGEGNARTSRRFPSVLPRSIKGAASHFVANRALREALSTSANSWSTGLRFCDD